jgi:hypothetical protein
MHQNAAMLIARLRADVSNGVKDPMHQNGLTPPTPAHADAHHAGQHPMYQNATALIARLQAQASDDEKDPMHQNGLTPPTPAHADAHRAG